MDDFSFSVLKLYSQRASLTLSQLHAVMDLSIFEIAEPVNYLRSQNYLKIDPNFFPREDVEEKGLIAPDTPLCISFEGKTALEAEEKARRKERFDNIRSWATTIVAVLAFIKSFFF